MKGLVAKVIRLTIILLLTAAQIAATAQNKPNASEKSYRRAGRILDAGIEALGGLDFLRPIQAFRLRETGKSHYVHQSAKPFPPFSSAPREETVIIDLRRNRSFYDLVNNLPGQTFRGGSIINGSEGFNLDWRAKTATAILNPSAANQRGLLRKLPHFVLLEALERAPAPTIQELRESLKKRLEIAKQ
ncbi:MAG: hypothetical protein M3384_10565 [Acidobacteriota bacterium]|nr:hypothetical protein [Acidobacteriota bacterium]